MNIAHLSTVHARSDTRIFEKMCCSLAELGHAVTLFVADGLGNNMVRGVQIIDIGRPANRLSRATIASQRMWLTALRGKHDILHFHDPELIPGGLVSRLLGKVVIYDIHEYYSLHLRRTSSLPRLLRHLLASAYGLLERAATGWLSASVVVSPHMLQVLPVKRAIVVGNAVRTEALRPGPLPHRERPQQVCYIGVLAEDRSVASMVDAISQTPARLALAGRWYPQTYRKQMSSRTGWSHVVEWGMADRNGVQTLLNQSRAGLLILDLHGDEQHFSSNKLFEYMAAGIPVIANSMPFTRAVIERHGCGLLVPGPDDSQAIAAAIRWILEHPEAGERMGRAGRLAVEQDYGWDQAFGQLLALYRNLGGGRAPTGALAEL